MIQLATPNSGGVSIAFFIGMADAGTEPPKQIIWENTFITEPEGYGQVRPRQRNRPIKSCESGIKHSVSVEFVEERLNGAGICIEAA